MLAKYGSATEPIVAAVATLDPDTAENTPHDTMLVWSSPPGMRWRKRFSARYSFSDSPARSMISPISRKSGIATSRKFELGFQSIWPM